MTTFTGSPKILKGAIIGIDLANPVASAIIFKYNPETMTRSLEAQTAGGSGSIFETQRFKGPPKETISLELRIDTIDQLEKSDGTAATLGIYPQLSALEMLIYPKSALVIANTALMAAGFIEIAPPVGPLILFIWGPQRAVPVQLSDFSVTEEAWDTNLNPIRANVSLGMRVLSYNDLSLIHPGYWIYMTHHIVKEVFATIGTIGNLGRLGELNPF